MSLRLRPDQEQVVAYRKGYMAVPAVPGAGKTTVLAALAADLISEGLHQPGRILIVTYTNSAVGNFKSRIGDFLEERGYPRHQGYEVRTIHSLAMNIVRDRPEAIGWSENFLIMDEVRLGALLERLTLRWIGQHRALWESLMKDSLKGSYRDRAEEQWEQRTQQIIRNLIGAFKSRRLSPQTAYDLTRHLPEESALRWAADLYGEYQRELAVEGAVDFGDLMLGAHQLLAQDHELLGRLRRRWTYIFEDEAQDSYRLQEQVLKLLAGPDGNLVRVGDANQAIMGTFTSAEPDLFRRFTREPGVAVRPLTMAGRSSREILDLANELVRWSRTEHLERPCRTALEDQQIRPVPPGFGQENPAPDGYRIVARNYETYEREMQETARLAMRSVLRSPEKSLAILLPTNAMVTAMVEILSRAGAEVRQLGGPTSDDRLQTAADLLAVMNYLAAPHEGERLLNAIGHLMQLEKASDAPCAAFLRGCRPEELFYPADGSTPFELLYQACPGCRGDLDLSQALEHLARWLPLAPLPADELLLAVAIEMGLEREELAIAHYMVVRARRLLQENPVFALPETVRELESEMQAMGRFADTLHDRKGFRPLPGTIYVTTCHSAKGLEWDTVFVPALTRGEYPSLSQDKIRSELWFLPDDYLNPEALALAELDAILGEDLEMNAVSRAKFEQLNERLRLFYVGITRARENLLLSCHQQDRWGKTAYPALAYQHLKRFIEQRGG